MLDAADVKPDARNDAKQARNQKRIMARKAAETRGNQHQSPYYNKE